MNQQPPPSPPYRPPGSPGPVLRHSGLGVAGFVVALVGFLLGGIPFVGIIGLVGLVMCIVDLQRAKQPGTPPQKRGLPIAGSILGILATGGVIAWTLFVVWFDQATKKGSCPHVYSWNGDGWALDGDLASGALYRGAERDDMDRLESLVPVDGQYRVRIQNDLQEIDNVDRLSLVVVDAPPDVEVLPTQSNDVVGVRDAAPALEVANATTSVGENPRDVASYTFARPTGVVDRAMLVVKARNTAFAEDAFVAYMAKMGSGVRPLMEFRADSAEGCACYQKYLAEEVERMGLPMWVSAGASKTVVQPVGPAILRAQAVPIEVPRDGDRIVVRLATTPRFWEIADVRLAPVRTDELAIEVLEPTAASSAEGASRLTHADERRVVLSPGESIDVRYDAPLLVDGRRRTVVAKLRGYYDLDIGGQKGVNIAQIVAHRAGWVSLPRYAAKMR